MMKHRHPVLLSCLLAAFVLFPAHASHARDQHVIVCGAGGEAAYEERFQDWSTRLRDVLLQRCGVAQEDLHYLGTWAEGEKNALETVRGVLAAACAELGESGTLYLYLIGHGSAQRNEAKFILPGPDLEVSALLAVLQSAPPPALVLVNGASSSAAFINALSGAARTIVTSTNSVEERNATEFMEYFIGAIESGDGDRNQDGQISVLEAADQAATAAQSWYESQGLIVSEHALIDDNGDRLGTRLPLAGAPAAASDDGTLAAALLLQPKIYSAAVPKEAIEAYRAAVESVEVWKAQKATQDEDTYYTELEKRLLVMARAGRVVRRAQE
ncbi:MAG: hypothetical protein HYV27_16145 [Candidatus Hydrogenedentes bacterium]|nr:hypothetical protein [Candidatus Hydrogenedentota bacterium]